MMEQVKLSPAMVIRKLLRAVSLLACAVAATFALSLLPVDQARSEVLNSDKNWTVTFTDNAEMQSNFSTGDVTEFVGTMQPGDTCNVAVSLKNDYSNATDWYMTNKIVSSLEESAASASGGTYSYTLRYIDPDGKQNTLFSSDTVGGDNSAGKDVGLHEISSALQDYFYLGTIGSKQNAKVELSVVLDGETQGNRYQNTLADLAMDFAVEITSDAPGGSAATPITYSTGHLPQTGDMIMSFVATFAIVAAIALVLFVIAIIGRRKQKQQEEVH